MLGSEDPWLNRIDFDFRVRIDWIQSDGIAFKRVSEKLIESGLVVIDGEGSEIEFSKPVTDNLGGDLASEPIAIIRGESA